MARIGRKSKYSPETVEVILSAIAETGLDKAGFTAAGITRDTFYRWLSDFSDFSDLVQKAHDQFRATRPTLLRTQAVQRLAEYVRGEAVEVYTKTTSTKDPKGKLISTTRSVTEIRRGCPQWAIDRVLGKSMPVLEAVQVLLNEGIATPQMAAIIESNLDNMQRELRDASNGDRQVLEASFRDAS